LKKRKKKIKACKINLKEDLMEDISEFTLCCLQMKRQYTILKVGRKRAKNFASKSN
jgi:hypothetical protein